jgi:hypothetical protein
MKKKFTFRRFASFSVWTFFLILISFGCKKSETATKLDKPQLDSVSQQNILKIAATREKFNQWVDTVFKYKLGTPPDYTLDIQPKYDIQKVTFKQIDSFEIAEVIIKTDLSTFNFFIGTLFNFNQAPDDKQFVLKPITTIPTPIRTLIFSSGDSGSINMTCSTDTVYTFKTDQKNLFFLGAM